MSAIRPDMKAGPSERSSSPEKIAGGVSVSAFSGAIAGDSAGRKSMTARKTDFRGMETSADHSSGDVEGKLEGWEAGTLGSKAIEPPRCQDREGNAKRARKIATKRHKKKLKESWGSLQGARAYRPANVSLDD